MADDNSTPSDDGPLNGRDAMGVSLVMRPFV